MSLFVRMVGFVIRRLITAAAVLTTASLLLFLAFAAAPGDPRHAAMGAQVALTGTAQPSWGQAAEAPLLSRAGLFLRGLRNGEFTTSYRLPGVPVAEIIGETLPVTLMLAATALVLAAGFGIGAGLMAALTRHPWRRKALAAFFTACLSLPSAALAAFLIWWLAISWRLLPAAGWGDSRSLIAPVLVLMFPAIGHIGRMAHALAGQIAPLPHVRTAVAKGLAPRQVAVSHVLWNIAAPLTAFLGTAFSALMGGTVLVETLFAIPGLGREAVAATLARDYPVALGSMLTLILINGAAGAAADIVALATAPHGPYGPTAPDRGNSQ